jgi:hypothetical protein
MSDGFVPVVFLLIPLGFKRERANAAQIWLADKTTASRGSLNEGKAGGSQAF